MADDDLDRELRRRFGELRAADDARTPGFGPLLARPRAAGKSRRRPGLALGLAAAAAAGAVAVLLLRPPREREAAAVPGTAAAIADWRSPTESLLETPGDDLYRDPRPAAEPLPDWVLELASPPPGAPAPSTPVRKGAAS